MKKLLYYSALILFLFSASAFGQIKSSSVYFNPNEHVYINGYNLSNQPVYVNGFAKIGRLPKKGEEVSSYYLYGFIDNNLKIILKPDYYELNNFKDGLARVCKQIKYKTFKSGFINEKGIVVIPFIYDCDNSHDFSEGLCAVSKSDGLYGFINKSGKTIIPFIYKEASYDGFKNGLARVSPEGTIVSDEGVFDYSVNISKEGKIVEEFGTKRPSAIKTKNNVVNNNGNQGCESTIIEYEKFAKEFIKYSNSVKAGTVKFNLNEFVKWEKEIRKQNNLIMECATAENRLRVLKIMNKVLPAVQSLYGTSSSSSVSSSNSSSKSPSSNVSKPKVISDNPKKSNDKRVDLSTEIITQSVSCKFCNSTVTVQRNVPRSPEFKSSFNEIGGITSSMCRKCNKTSSFNYEMRAGNFVRIY